MSACTVEVSIVPNSEQFWDATRPLCTSTGYVTFPDADTLEGKILVQRSTSGNGYVIQYDAEQPSCSLWGQCNTALLSMMINGLLFLFMTIILVYEWSRYETYRTSLQRQQVSFAGLSTKVS